MPPNNPNTMESLSSPTTSNLQQQQQPNPSQTTSTIKQKIPIPPAPIPPPPPNVTPGYGGPISNPHQNDVLSGRGNKINSHPGNVRFRQLIQSLRPYYVSRKTKKYDKPHISAQIVNLIRGLTPPGRFLRRRNEEEEEGCFGSTDGMWMEIGDLKAREKAAQALRESSSSSLLDETSKTTKHSIKQHQISADTVNMIRTLHHEETGRWLEIGEDNKARGVVNKHKRKAADHLRMQHTEHQNLVRMQQQQLPQQTSFIGGIVNSNNHNPQPFSSVEQQQTGKFAKKNTILSSEAADL